MVLTEVILVTVRKSACCRLDMELGGIMQTSLIRTSFAEMGHW
jgi:hypothetical protein